MSRHKELLLLAWRCEKETHVSACTHYARLTEVFTALHGPPPLVDLNRGGSEYPKWEVAWKPFQRLLEAGGFTDAALSLTKDVIWLSPIINYQERSVQLLNGSGMPVAGNDYYSVGDSIPLAIAAAWLKVHSGQIPYDIEDPGLSLEINKLYMTPSGNKFRIVKEESGCFRGQDRKGTRLDFHTNGKAASQHEDLIMEVPTRG